MSKQVTIIHPILGERVVPEQQWLNIKERNERLEKKNIKPDGWEIKEKDNAKSSRNKGNTGQSSKQTED